MPGNGDLAFALAVELDKRNVDFQGAYTACLIARVADNPSPALD